VRRPPAGSRIWRPCGANIVIVGIVPNRKYAAVKLSLVAGFLLAGCLLHPEPLAAQAAPAALPPFAFARQYSAVMVITVRDGNVITNKVYMDGGKVRSELAMQDNSMAMIVRPDQQKVYRVIVDQKLVMEMPLDPAHYDKLMGPAGPNAKIEAVGPETVNGIACMKYKVTTPDGKICDLWVDAAKKAPVKLVEQDGTYSAEWKNYQTGPQPAALFDPPADYHKVAAPVAPPAAPASPQGGQSDGGQ
jgi:hypothetical protein